MKRKYACKPPMLVMRGLKNDHLELSEQCRLLDMSAEREAKHLAQIADIPPGQITSAIRTTEIAWEMEKLQRGEAA